MRIKSLFAPVLAAGMVTAVGVASIDGPADAAPKPKPDLLLSLTKSGGYVGEDEYPPVSQVVDVDLAANERKDVFVRLENDGGRGKIVFSGAESNSGRKIKYTKGRNRNVTAKVTGPKGLRLFLPRDKGVKIRVRIKDLGTETGDDKFFVQAEDKKTGTNADSVGPYIDRP